MNNGKQPINPSMWTKCGDGEDDYQPLKDGQKTGWEVKFGGLTKREYFAVLLLQGMVANANRDLTYDYVEGKVKDCIAHADELLKQLEL